MSPGGANRRHWTASRWRCTGLTLSSRYVSRASEFGCSREAYKRVRDLIAGVVLLQIAQYEDALGWAMRVQRHG